MVKLKSIITEIITEYEKGEPLTFTHDCVDSHGGENYCNLYAKDKNGNVVGKIEFSTYLDDVHVKFIRVQKGERRNGIGIQMAKKLQRLYPNSEILWGYTFPAGSKFLKKLPRTFHQNTKYWNLKKKLDQLKAQYMKSGMRNPSKHNHN